MRLIAKTCLIFLTLIPTARAGDNDVVARMGESTLTLRDARQLAEQNPQEAQNLQSLERLLRIEAMRRYLADEARKQSFDKKPEVAARMAHAADQALAAAYMNSIARPPADYPSEAQLQEAYAANKAAFTTDRQFRLSQIYIPGTDEKARKEAEELRQLAAQKKADFAAIARKSSKHAPSAAAGGDMGWLAEKSLQPAIRKAVQGLSKGQVTPVVAGEEGFHIIRLVDIREPEVLPLDKVKDALTQSLRLRKAQEIEAAYLEKLQARMPIAINEIALSELATGNK